MNTQNPNPIDADFIVARLQKLEAENAQLRKRLSLLIAVFFAPICLLTLGAMSPTPADTSPTPRKLVLEQLSIVDSTGTQRAFLGVDDDKVARLRLFHEKGAKGFSAWAAATTYKAAPNSAGWTVSDASDTIRLTGQLNSKDSALFAIADTSGKDRVNMAAVKDYTYIIVADTSGKDRVVISARKPDGLASVGVLDNAGQSRLEQAVVGTNALFRTYDPNGNLRWASMTDKFGFSSESHYDAAENMKRKFSLAADGSKFENYNWKDAATQFWETTGNVMQAIDILERLSGSKKDD